MKQLTHEEMKAELIVQFIAMLCKRDGKEPSVDPNTDFDVDLPEIKRLTQLGQFPDGMSMPIAQDKPGVSGSGMWTSITPDEWAALLEQADVMSGSWSPHLDHLTIFNMSATEL